MMGIKQRQQHLFNYQVNLDKRVRSDHPLRRINEIIDFTFVRYRVEKYYGYNRNVSVDPAVIMKMMFLLFYEMLRQILINVRQGRDSGGENICQLEKLINFPGGERYV